MARATGWRLLMVALGIAAAGSVPVRAGARINGLSLKGGARGVVLVVSAEGTFGEQIDVSVTSTSPTTSLLSLTIRGASYDLGIHRFTELPADCPVSEVAARVREGYDVVELAVAAHVPPEQEPVVKIKDGQVLVLCSRAPTREFTWDAPVVSRHAVAEEIAEGAQEWAVAEEEAEPEVDAAEVVQPEGEAAEAAQEQVQPELATLRDVAVVTRAGVERLTFAFAGATRPLVRCEDGRVVLLFGDALNGTMQQRLEPPVGGVFQSIELKQRMQGDRQWLGAIVTVAEGADGPWTVYTRGSEVCVQSRAQEHLYAAWSSERGSYASADLRERLKRPEPVVAVEEKPAEPAVEAVEADVAEAEAVEADVVEAPQATAEEPEPPVQGYLTVTGTKVNMRAEPTTEGDNVVGQLERGATVALLSDSGAWRRIRVGTRSGWVFGALLAENKVVETDTEVAQAVKESPPPVMAASMMPTLGTVASSASFAQAPSGTAPAAAPPVPSGNSHLAALAPSKADSVQLPRQHVVQYTTFGRDPFVPYSRKIDEGVPAVENIVLVGVLYDQTDRIALFEDELFKEKSYTMRESDQVSNGTLWRITPGSAVFLITELGITRAYTLELRDVSPTKVQSKRGT